MISYCISKKDVLIFPDQDVINGVFCFDILPLDLKYNCQTVLYEFSYNDMIRYRRPHKFYSKEIVCDSLDNPVIIHFSGGTFSPRPWIEGCKHPKLNLWIRYKNNSPWSDFVLFQNKTSFIKKVIIRIYFLLPQSVSSFFGGLRHSFFVPVIKRMRNKLK